MTDGARRSRFAIKSLADAIAGGALRTYGQGRLDFLQEVPLPHSDTGVVLKAGHSVYEPPGALHSVSRNASDELPASLIAFFVLGEGESPTIYDHD